MRPARRALLAPAVTAALLALTAPTARAGSLVFCDRPQPVSAQQQDRLLRFAALVKDELQRSGRRAALIARSGTDLSRFDVRYSHAGVTLAGSDNGPWSVRQLYFACEEGRPRLFDQGMSGFIFGTDNPRSGHISLLLLPEEATQALEAAALDKRRALGLLAARYSANAHAFALDYQNCNQWVAELLAEAWGAPLQAPGDATRPAPTDLDTGTHPDPAPGPDTASPAQAPAQDPAQNLAQNLTPEGIPQAAVRAHRAAAQAWLQAQGYQPHRFDLGWRPLVWLAGVLPWLHTDDHPAADRAAAQLRVSMPQSLEAFVRQRLPQAERVELCHHQGRALRRRGWQAPLPADCQPGPDDEVISLE